MDIDKIRTLIITAICSDDYLLETLVLKGGNALNLIHKIANRASFDLDFSIPDDFEDLEDVKRRLFSMLKERFATKGYIVFDEKLVPKPRIPRIPYWGGYKAEFKIISRKKAEELDFSLEKIRKQSESIGDSKSSRTFKIEISKFEYVDGKEEVELEDYTCYVYTLDMIVAEKLRAICQQMEGYEPTKEIRRARARDFYDIYMVVNSRALDFSTKDFQELVTQVFKAKEVPINFLGRIKEERDFHIRDWQDVVSSAKGDIQKFDFYFDFVVKNVEKLNSLWIK